MRKSVQWCEPTSPDFAARDMTNAIAVLPVAAIEQHGPHLPTGVDAMIMEGYLERVLTLLPDDIDTLFLPLQNIGTSHEHIDFPGTLTLAPETLMHMLIDIGSSVSRTGCRKLILVNSHGGNSSVLDLVARELRRQHHMLAVTVSWSQFGYPARLFDAEEIAHGIHGGDIETSLMLAFQPAWVRTENIADFPPSSLTMTRDFKWLNSSRPAGFGWMAQDLSPSGAMGAASRATREKGETCATHGARAFIELLCDEKSSISPDCRPVRWFSGDASAYLRS